MNPQTCDWRWTLPTGGESGELHCFEHQAMACTWGLLIAGEPARGDEGRGCLRFHVPTFSRSYAAQAARAAFAEIDHVEQELSRYLPTSDIARINALRTGESVLIGDAALECLELAAQVYADTGGAFDVTVGAMVGSASPAPVGMNLLQIDRPTRRVGFRADGLIVDLGGIGKGYAIDRAVAILRDWSITAAILHAGQSTVFALGQPPGAVAADVPVGRGGAAWVIGIRDPQDAAVVLAEVRLRDAALSGSGTRLHGPHIVDPRTRRPAAEAIGAWAVAPAAALADALSTAFMVMRVDAVAAYCEQHAEVGGLLCSRGSAGCRLRRFGRTLSWRPSDPQG